MPVVLKSNSLFVPVISQSSYTLNFLLVGKRRAMLAQEWCGRFHVETGLLNPCGPLWFLASN